METTFKGLFLLVVLACGACTRYINAPTEPYTEYPAAPKKPMTVGLVETEALKNAEWVHPVFGETWRMPLGDNLMMNSEVLARTMFQNVVVAGSKDEIGQQVDAVLMPQLRYANRTRGATSFGESIVTVQLEWRATDAADKPLWIETVTGEASGTTGWTDPDDLLAKALEQLWRDSWQTLAAADYGQR
jgi:hypothetical protein